jgi:hypothetical protein
MNLGITSKDGLRLDSRIAIVAITGVENRILGVNHGEADWGLRIIT